MRSRRNPIPPLTSVRFKPTPKRPLRPEQVLAKHWNRAGKLRILYALASFQRSIDPFIARYAPKSPASMLTQREEPYRSLIEGVPEIVWSVGFDVPGAEERLARLAHALEHRALFLHGPRIKGAVALGRTAILLSPYGADPRKAREHALSVVRNASIRLSRVFGVEKGPALAAMLLQEWFEQQEPVPSWHQDWRVFWDRTLGPRQLFLPFR